MGDRLPMFFHSDTYTAICHSVINYVIRVGDATSQFLNVVVFFSDNPNESLSGRAWRNRNKSRFWGIMKAVIDFVAYPLERDHCEKSHLADVTRAGRLLRNQGL